jgi:hypothetical protein
MHDVRIQIDNFLSDNGKSLIVTPMITSRNAFKSHPRHFERRPMLFISLYKFYTENLYIRLGQTMQNEI